MLSNSEKLPLEVADHCLLLVIDLYNSHLSAHLTANIQIDITNYR